MNEILRFMKLAIFRLIMIKVRIIVGN